jgi:hypothetical protein
MKFDDMKKTLSEHFVEVVFTKKNGEQRTMKCTTMKDLVPESGKTGFGQPTTNTVKENTDVVVAYDLVKSDWRSFRVDSVISFNTIDSISVHES